MTSQTPRVLSIAGTDPTGGAGIQADLKSIGALGGYGMAVVTALVAQNTLGVREVHVPPAEFLRAQLDAVSDDVHIDAVKLGMLHSSPLIEVVSAWLDEVRPAVVVLDPVMVSTSGHRLLDAEAERSMRALCSRVDLVTPNIPELAVLVDAEPATTWIEAVGQARLLARVHNVAVLLKGGHLDGQDCPDAIVDFVGATEVAGRRIRTSNTHGTGCSLSSAMATLRGRGLSWVDALTQAKQWLRGAIEAGAALNVGHGNGPVDHFFEQHETGWAERWWSDAAAVRAAVDDCDFVSRLGDGTLERERFQQYLAQDAVYLEHYARVLAHASALAPSVEEQVFWSRSATSALAEEAELHRSHIGTGRVVQSAVTRNYTSHLLASAAGGSYAEVVAALLPCFWLYADLGSRLVGLSHVQHPYADWLAAYGDTAFEQATREAVDIVDRAASVADPVTRERMREAFAVSMAHELEFFNQTDA